MRGLTVLGALVLASAAAAAPETPFAIVEDVPVAVRLERGEARWTRAFVVPEGATRLRAAVSSRQDVDLYLRRGTASGDDPAGGADARAEGGSGEERLDVAAAPGPWHVAVVHRASARGGANAAVLVTFEGPGRAPLLLDGESTAVEGPTAFRTWLPPDAEGLRIESGADVMLRGPDGVRMRRASEGPMVLLRRDGVPPGVFAGQATPPRRGERATTLRVQVLRAGPSPDGVVPLSPGTEEEFRLGGDAPPERSFRVEVPPGAGALTVSVVADEGAGADFDVYVRRAHPMRLNDEEADWLGVASGSEERLTVGGEAPIAPGTYHLDVTTVDGERPAAGTLLVGIEPLGRTTWGREPPALAPGRWADGTIRSGASAVAWFAVEVPRTATRLFAQVLDASSPVDLVLARRDDGAILRRALSERVDEALEAPLGPDLAPGARCLLGVVNRTVGEEEVAFRVAVSFDRPPALPSDLRSPPFHDPSRLNPTERVAAAVAEVMVRGTGGGSATCVAPNGLLLSCRHVLEVGEGSGLLQREGILVAFPDEFPRPPRQVFLARLVEADEPMDLALLELTGDVYGRPLPADLRLPFLRLGDAGRLSLGEHVTAFGYPEAGSEHCRTGIIVSRGIVAGLESDRDGLVWVKTDAWIANGHSGGALVDSGNDLVGVPTATLGDRRTLGLVRPVSRVPERWKALIRKGLQTVSK